MTEIEYQLYSQRGAELREQAAHQRLVTQARQARQARQAGRARQGGLGRLGRLAAGLRRAPRRAHQAGTGRPVRAVGTARAAGAGEC